MLTIQSPQQAESILIHNSICYILCVSLISLCAFRSSTQFRGILLADLGKNG